MLKHDTTGVEEITMKPITKPHLSSHKTTTLNAKSEIRLLKEENKRLKEQLEKTTSDKERLKNKLKTILKEFFNNGEHQLCSTNIEMYINNEKDFNELIASKKKSLEMNNVEKENDHIEELETRLTQQSNQIVRLTLTHQQISDAMNSVKTYNDIPQMRHYIQSLQYDICDMDSTKKSEEASIKDDTGCTIDNIVETLDKRKRQIAPAVPTLIVPLSKTRLSGDTHISRMNPELKDYIISVLNLHKPSGGDWRMLARRIGIHDDVIQSWTRNHSPMERLWCEWSKSGGATVRLLHRHVSSPDIKHVILVAWIAKFYHIH